MYGIDDCHASLLAVGCVKEIVSDATAGSLVNF